MQVNSSGSALSQQLIQSQLNQDQQNRKPRADDLIEQAKQVDQDQITLGAGETALANREMPRPVKSASKIAPELLQTKTTMNSITERYQQNYEALKGRQPGSEKGRNIDTRA